MFIPTADEIITNLHYPVPANCFIFAATLKFFSTFFLNCGQHLSSTTQTDRVSDLPVNIVEHSAEKEQESILDFQINELWSLPKPDQVVLMRLPN